MTKPDPKDPKYADKVNLFCKDMREWERLRWRSLRPIPNDDLDRSVSTDAPARVIDKEAEAVNEV